MKSKYINGTINKDIYIHTDANTEHRIDVLEEEIQTKQDKLTAGENITIENNVISATASIDPSMITTEVNAQSTDEQIPTAKAVYNAISGSFYDSIVYYDDNATFDDNEAYLGEFNIPADIQELKVTIDGTEYTLKKYTDGEYYGWANEDSSVEIQNDGNACYIWAVDTSGQTLPVKVEGQVLSSEFVNAVNNAITYYDVYLDNQTVTFNEHNVAELGLLDINPEETQKLILTVYGHQSEYVWDNSEDCFIHTDDGSAIFDEEGVWYLYVPNSACAEITISLSSGDVKEDFKEAVEAVGAGATVFEVEYGTIKSNPYGAYTLLNGKTMDDIADAFYDSKPVYLMCGYGYTQTDQSVQLDKGTKSISTLQPCITLWQVEYVGNEHIIKDVSGSDYTIKTNVAQVCTDVNAKTYKNIRLICNAGGDDNKFFGYEEELNVTFELTSNFPKLNAYEPTEWFLTDDKRPSDIYNAFSAGKTVYLTTNYNYVTYRYIVTSAQYTQPVESINIKAGNTHMYDIYAESFAGIDPDENAQMKYLQLDDTENGQPFILYNKTLVDETSSEFSDIKSSVKSFVVFDGDLTLEEYFDPNNDVNIGRIVNPSEFDEIENGDARSTSHCPALYDYVEIDGEPLVKARNSPLWYSSDDESFVSIGNEDGIGEDVYLEIRANSAGTHHIKILASYGGTAYIGYGGASITAYLNLTPRDVKIAYRTLKKVILAFQPLGGGPSANYSTLSHFNELEDLNEEELYTIECGGFAYFAKYLRNFKSDSSLRTTRIDATIVNYFETSDTYPEDSVISSSISPDQLISAINSGMMVNISFVRSFGDGATTDVVPSIYYQITNNETYGIYTIELQPPYNYSGVALHGITTNNLFDKSNEWYHMINPLNLNVDDPTEPDVEIPPTPDPGMGMEDM